MENIKVAIVEDLNEIRDAIRVLVNGSHGFECKFAFANGEDAIKELPQHSLDAVILDIHLPGISGVETLIKLKPLMPQTQFTMYTVYDDDDHIFDALKNGANGYLLKRTSPAQILEALRELVSGSSPMSGEIARKVIESLQKKEKPNASIEELTEREREILILLSDGFLYKEIAAKLFISKDTVKSHINHIYQKLHVQTRMEAVNKVFSR